MIRINFYSPAHSDLAWYWVAAFWVIELFSKRIVHADLEIVAREDVGASRGPGVDSVTIRANGVNTVLVTSTVEQGVRYYDPRTRGWIPAESYSIVVEDSTVWEAIKPLLGTPYSLADFVVQALPDINYKPKGLDCSATVATILVRSADGVGTRFDVLKGLINSKKPYKLHPRALRDLVVKAGYVKS